MVRQIVAILLGLMVSAGVSYALLLYMLALSFDGPGHLSVTEAARWIAMAIGTLLGGFAIGYLIVRKLVKAHLATTLVMLPGLALSAYLCNQVVQQALLLARY